ncbi:hypothetical protein EV421DRAFT_1742192 [Armillaria borealis]|uniref:SET domain-containing protein n=1 Tax=Armillaria borealis TaxID=47425 RepID=A0AA39IYB3_9AGAR|nr:hypothetical protein EV421DRAFT_1742192 [Armillaria borealis]
MLGHRCMLQPQPSGPDKEAQLCLQSLNFDDGRLKDFEGIPIFECHEGCLCNDRVGIGLFNYDIMFISKLKLRRRDGAKGIFLSGSDSVRKGLSLELILVNISEILGILTKLIYQNHSCEPNCRVVACYVNEGNLAKALIAIFTEREIHPGEELTLSYFGSIQVSFNALPPSLLLIEVKANAWYNAVGP